MWSIFLSSIALLIKESIKYYYYFVKWYSYLDFWEGWLLYYDFDVVSRRCSDFRIFFPISDIITNPLKKAPISKEKMNNRICSFKIIQTGTSNYRISDRKEHMNWLKVSLSMNFQRWPWRLWCTPQLKSLLWIVQSIRPNRLFQGGWIASRVQILDSCGRLERWPLFQLIRCIHIYVRAGFGDQFLKRWKGASWGLVRNGKRRRELLEWGLPLGLRLGRRSPGAEEFIAKDHCIRLLLVIYVAFSIE